MQRQKVNEKNSQDALTEHLPSAAKMGTEFLFTEEYSYSEQSEEQGLDFICY